MSSFPAAIRHNLSRLATFAGRDSRSQFWFYILGLFLVEQALSILLVAALIGTGFLGGGAADDGAHFAAMFNSIMWAVVAFPIVAIVLVAAAITRRLHDRGLRGWWGAMPLPFLTVGEIGMYRLMSGFAAPAVEPDHRLFLTMFVNNAVYLLTILILIVLLVKESDPGDNRFGPMPAA